MAHTKRCSHCGASNPESAQWCSLCHERFTEPDVDPAPMGVEIPSRDSSQDLSPDAAESPARPSNGPGHADHGAFQASEDGIKWICITCERANSLEVQVCEVCGTTFAETVRPRSDRPQVEPAKAALFSLFFPGAGHAYMGMWGQAIARGVLSFWVLLVTTVGILDKKVPGSLLMATIFGLAALALWLIAAHDAFQEASNEPGKALLKGRRFLFLVLGLMALLFVIMLVALVTARSRVDGETLSIPSWRSTSSLISTEQPTT